MTGEQTTGAPGAWENRIDAISAGALNLPGWRGWIYTRTDDGGMIVRGAVCPARPDGQPDTSKADPATFRDVYLTSEQWRL